MSAKALKYCIPQEAGLASEARAVGRRIGKLLDALDSIGWNVCEGQIAEDMRELRSKILKEMRAEGWRITVNGHDKWQVLPPKD